MQDSARPVDRLLRTPNLTQVVPHLQPAVLHRVIQTFGLEDCVEIVACSTPQQISRVLDADVWRAPSGGADETLDASRFGVWLEVLMEAGTEIAIQKLVGLDQDLVMLGLAQHVAVFDSAAVSSFVSLDGAHVPSRAPRAELSCELGGYLIEARRTTSWDVIVTLLASLATDCPDDFHRLMTGCRRLSNGRREADTSHDLLEDEEQKMFDLAVARESRREREGFVSPAQARAFLHSARQVELTSHRAPSQDAVTRAYFAGIDAEHAGDEAVHAILLEAANTPHVRALLTQGSGSESPQMALVQAFMAAHGSAAAVVYLANVLMAGCSVHGRPFTSHEASDAVLATCNLGLENWPDTWRDQNLVTAFQIGWTILYRDACVYAANQLASTLTQLHCRDRDIQMQLIQLRLELTKSCAEEAPWRARAALDAIVMLDAASWAALVGLIAECPVLHAALTALVRGSKRHAPSVSPTSFEFIAENRQMFTIRHFLFALPDLLV